MLDVMLDLETMGNGPNAAIIAIGAVEFDIHEKRIGERFYVVVDLQSSVSGGGVIDPSTVLWWMKQSEEAKAEFERSGEHLATALIRFAQWLSDRGPADTLKMWGNGAAFDNTILASAYRNMHLERPWTFWNDRCYRTIKALNPQVPFQHAGTHHNAVDDAESQARHLIAILG